MWNALYTTVRGWLNLQWAPGGGGTAQGVCRGGCDAAKKGKGAVLAGETGGGGRYMTKTIFSEKL